MESKSITNETTLANTKVLWNSSIELAVWLDAQIASPGYARRPEM